MAYDLSSVMSLGQIKKLIQHVNDKFDLTIRSILLEGNKINFYHEESATSADAPAFSIDLPVEYFLDQTQTKLESDFVFDAAKYPDAADPNLNGKPVMVLAVKGDNDSVNYSFIDLSVLASIINIESGDSAKILELEDGEDMRKLKFKISSSDGNILEAKDDGAYATTSIDGAVENNLIVADDKSMPVDSKRTFATDEEVEEMLNEVLGL